jgi:hypothetical protein
MRLLVDSMERSKAHDVVYAAHADPTSLDKEMFPIVSKACNSHNRLPNAFLIALDRRIDIFHGTEMGRSGCSVVLTSPMRWFRI